MTYFAAMRLPEFLQLHWQLILFIVFCSIAFIQLFIISFFFSRLCFGERPKATSRTNAVSVIVCARDEVENLPTTRPVYGCRIIPPHEVIVVNDNSFDDSKYLLEELRKTFRQLHVVELTQKPNDTRQEIPAQHWYQNSQIRDRFVNRCRLHPGQ